MGVSSSAVLFALLLRSVDWTLGKRFGLNFARLAFVGDTNEGREAEPAIPPSLLGLAFGVTEVVLAGLEGESLRRFAKGCSMTKKGALEGACSLECPESGILFLKQMGLLCDAQVGRHSWKQ